MFKRMLFIGMMFLLFSCSQNPMSSDSKSNETLEIDARTNQDSNGYYHLRLDRSNNQTIHMIFANTGSADLLIYQKPKVSWQAYDLNGNVKTWTYIQFGREFVVDIINHISRSAGDDGIAKIQFAPVFSMIGDTVRVIANYDSQTHKESFIAEVYIILD